MSSTRSPSVVLLGPTASGKSAVAHAAAVAAGDTELVTIDSMQVYRGMDVGTAKPSADEQAELRYHLLDLVEPDEEYTVARFQRDADAALARIDAAGHRSLAVGGTALYLRAIVDHLEIPGRFPEVRDELEAEPDSAVLHARLASLDPVAADRILPGNRRRVVRALEVTIGAGRPFSSFGPGLTEHPPTPTRLVGLRWPRPALDDRIQDRYEAMLATGLLAEVERLAGRPKGLSHTAGQALGYRELLAHLAGDLSLDAAVDLAVRRTRRFARRQERWFRRDPRIVWWDVDPDAGPEAWVDTLTALLRDADGTA